MKFTCKSCVPDTPSAVPLPPAEATLHAPRILLCASAAHCAQVLHAAAQARVPLHGLTPSTQWPTQVPSHAVVLWALLPPDTAPPLMNTEAAWRTQMLQGLHPWAIHMLYGQPRQQALQLAPWIPSSAPHDPAQSVDCRECLDAASEQKLFQHLLQRP